MRVQQKPPSIATLLTLLGLAGGTALLPPVQESVATAQSATRTATPRAGSPTIKTPEHAYLPLVLRGFDRLDFTPPPPGRTATVTPAAPATATEAPTETAAPSATTAPTATAVPTEAPSPTITPEPVALKGHVVIVDVLPFVTGASFEAVVLQNQGNAAEDLTGWHTVGQSRVQKQCTLPAGLILEPGAFYEVRSGKDAAAGQRDNARFGSVAGYVCSADFIWDNNLDMAILYNRDQTPVSRWCWNQSGPYTCP